MDITTLGIDLAKSVFQLHGVDAQGAIVLQKKLRRGAVVKFLSKLEPCLIGIEACATSHYWARGGPEREFNRKDMFTKPITGEELGQMNAHLNISIKKIVGDDNLAAFYEIQSEGIKHGEKSYQLMCSVNIISSV